MKAKNSSIEQIDAQTIRIQGDMTFETVTSLYQDSLPYFQKTDKLTIDCSGVGHFDSAALSLLLSWLRYAQASSQVILTFQKLSESLRQFISAHHLDTLLGLSS